MATNPQELPSRVLETLAVCPQFRILLVGKSGVGKSSLVSAIFNISINDIDIAHNRAGEADINREYTSQDNPRFVLHDSKGFEPGSEKTWDLVKKFVSDRCSSDRPLKERVHIIWLCLETPRTGSRLVQTGDVELLKLAQKFEVPVIVVFTKYDLLVDEMSVELEETVDDDERLEEMAEENAASTFEKRIHECGDVDFSSNEYVKVSTDKRYKDPNHRLKMLRTLTDVTRKRLHDVEGNLLVPWATAQQINAQQKVNYSIDEGFKKYWIDLGTSTFFEGQVLWNCISRIHRDILEVWNFNDPDKLLLGEQFCAEMVKLVEPLLRQPDPKSGDQLSQLSSLVSIGGTVAATFGQILGAAGIATIVIKFLYGKFQRSPFTALCLGAYIVDCTLILHNLFLETLLMEPPRPVSWELIRDTLENYKTSDASRTHGLVRDIVFDRVSLHPEAKIADLIRKELKMAQIG